MQEFKLTGGARIGIANASWPFASLTANRHRIQLNATILGKYLFLPDDITTIEPYTAGLGGKGIRIHHKVKGYDEKVIFWTTKNPVEVIRHIEATGFFGERERSLNISQSENEVREMQAKGGFPLKKPFAIWIIVLWNLLFISGIGFSFMKDDRRELFLLGPAMAIGFLVIVALLLLVSDKFAAMALKEGREVKYIKKIIFFVLIIAAFMAFNIASIVSH